LYVNTTTDGANKSCNGTFVGSNNSGTFTDSRNSKVYKWVKIGTQIWMAENLAYISSTGEVVCNSDQSKCNTYGYLYNWAAAMAISSTYNSSSYSESAKHKGACPTGWHIPSDAEWTTLTTYVGTNSGTKLKAKSGWNSNGNGTDDYGFAALPGGYISTASSISDVGSSGRWWSSTNSAATYAYYRRMSYDDANVYRYDYNKTHLYSVRCVKD
jgi:uncharacterized protein (TIGR02145 family)